MVNPELWALSAILGIGVLMIGYAALPDRTPTARRHPEHQPVHAAWRMDSATENLGAQVPGPVSEWPWGQQPARFMYDRRGQLTDTLGDPLGWMAAERQRIAQEQ